MRSTSALQPGTQIHPRCRRLIQALAAGYVYRQSHGTVLGEPEENESAAIVDAWLGALAEPVVSITAREKARIMGPKDLSVYMR
jgi:hypothetical protein